MGHLPVGGSRVTGNTRGFGRNLSTRRVRTAYTSSIFPDRKASQIVWAAWAGKVDESSDRVGRNRV